MATLPIPDCAVIPRARDTPPRLEQELLPPILAPKTDIQGRWILEMVKMLLTKLPPAQPPLPGILPQFNPDPPLQPHLSFPVPLSTIPRRTTTPVKKQQSRFATAIPSIKPAYEQPIDERHEQRLADLKTLLGPLTRKIDGTGDGDKLDNSGCVLLCWGSSSSCRVMAVPHIERTIDRELFWKKLQTAWYGTRGWWQQKVPWYGVRSVKRVDIRLVGPDAKAEDVFHGVYQPADKALETEMEKLRESAREAEMQNPEESTGIFADSESKLDPYDDDLSEIDPCWYNHDKGFTIHNPEVCGVLKYGYNGLWSNPNWGPLTCPVGKSDRIRERLTRLEMEPLRTLLLQNPKMAVYNELANAELVHTSRSILDQYQFRNCASLGQLVFRGLLVEDGWKFDATIAAIFMPLAVVASILIVIVAWLIYRDWGVAWNVGACFVPLLTGLGNWLFHAGASR
ncbi:hypothetical protein V493_08081 [Pseudogymnoascus sp. VKM F-4281 (FW-2241)]|nr:hypothetical protein V493_08081 [Pseudogymnoascus sp. VKM F-4281 (FW-2241)]